MGHALVNDVDGAVKQMLICTYISCISVITMYIFICIYHDILYYCIYLCMAGGLIMCCVSIILHVVFVGNAVSHP